MLTPATRKRTRNAVEQWRIFLIHPSISCPVPKRHPCIAVKPNYSCCSRFLSALSCSMICLLQLRPIQLLYFDQPKKQERDSLSTWEEPPLLGHFVPDFSFRTNTPRHGHYSHDNSRHYGCIGFPIRRLCIPSSSR